MKNYIILTYLLISFLIFGCSGTSTIEEIDYTQPVLKSQPRLLYPKEAQTNNYSGLVKMYLHISKTGKVEDVTILKSSGYEVLDEAALEYGKELVFIPAQNGGEAIECHITQDVNFDLVNRDNSLAVYISELKQLYQLHDNALSSERDKIEDEILSLHHRFVKKTNDILNFNVVLDKILLPETYSEWKKWRDQWPLTFLIYHDFIQRYPDYHGMEIAKDYLHNALYTDLNFISKSGNNIGSEKDRSSLVSKIKSFMEKNYPGIPLNDSRLNTEINS